MGYVRIADLAVSPATLQEQIRPFVQLSSSDTSLQALIRFYEGGRDLGVVSDAKGRALGLVDRQQLSEALFRLAT